MGSIRSFGENKKRRNIFTIGFNRDIPRHALAVDTLERLGRRKADFIARLIEVAVRNPEAFPFIDQMMNGHRPEPVLPVYAVSPDTLTNGYRVVENGDPYPSRKAKETAEKKPAPIQERKSVNAEAVVYESPDVSEEIPESMRESFLANLRYFEDLADDDDY